MKKGVLFNAEKLKLWLCDCGSYNCNGADSCLVCGKKRPDSCATRTPDTKPERRKQDALGEKSAFAQTIQEFTGRLHITIERHSPRILDDDNFIGGCKQLRDAIAELLGKNGDSTRDGLEFEYLQVKSKVKKTVVKIRSAI